SRPLAVPSASYTATSMLSLIKQREPSASKKFAPSAWRLPKQFGSAAETLRKWTRFGQRCGIEHESYSVANATCPHQEELKGRLRSKRVGTSRSPTRNVCEVPSVTWAMRTEDMLLKIPSEPQ